MSSSAASVANAAVAYSTFNSHRLEREDLTLISERETAEPSVTGGNKKRSAPDSSASAASQARTESDGPPKKKKKKERKKKKSVEEQSEPAEGAENCETIIEKGSSRDAAARGVVDSDNSPSISLKKKKTAHTTIDKVAEDRAQLIERKKAQKAHFLEKFGELKDKFEAAVQFGYKPQAYYIYIYNSVWFGFSCQAYRERVCSGLAKYHGIPEGGERRRRRPSGNAEPRKKNPTSKTTREPETERQIKVKVVKLRKRRTPVYKDPLASTKLEMIKSIRAKRVAEESKKMDAVERARLLIREAEKAAKVLEIAAMTSPVAQASLLESKMLIAEATQLIESIEMRQIASDEDGTSPQPSNSLPDVDTESDQEQPGDVNGTYTFTINGESLHLNMKPSDLPTFNIEGTTKQPNGTRVYPPPESNGAIKLPESPYLPNGSNVYQGMEEKAESLESGNVTKKWVRGRLVEVTEAA
ncbi:hypothetical protein DY000_02060593 [Brassica cretica]|uniref:Uncharacterized protein n=1 Tax=Brassica cretica TaxID=69181 RepID=A0ABQ7ATM9_BRACR|nr:hypothetical protein DY000_02060593 [Brassica cretica]